jgi:hypothetical protein
MIDRVPPSLLRLAAVSLPELLCSRRVNYPCGLHILAIGFAFGFCVHMHISSRNRLRKSEVSKGWRGIRGSALATYTGSRMRSPLR